MPKKTVFVIGAGASAEAKLPTGDQLKYKISELLHITLKRSNNMRGDQIVFDAIKEILSNKPFTTQVGKPELNQYIEAANKIAFAMPLAISIDNFIDAHQGDEKLELCGKLAIVRSILAAEKTSSLFFNSNSVGKELDFSSLSDTWYTQFFRRLTENCAKENLKQRFNSVSLVIFNYDRCIEHFLYHALQKYYYLPKEKAADLVYSLKIYHPYGSVGELPWKNGTEGINFGGEPTPIDLINLSKRIKTFTEGIDPASSEIIGIKGSLETAERIIYLGYGFHQLNMELLSPINNAANIDSIPQVLATVYKTSINNQKSIIEKIKRNRSQWTQPVLEDKTCNKFFIDNSEMLGFV